MNETSALPNTGASKSGSNKPNATMGRLKFLGIALICVLPALFSYLAYYVMKPTGRTNYGELIEPQRSALALPLTRLDGKPLAIASLQKRFTLVVVQPSDCNRACQNQLFTIRQLRLMTGPDQERVERLWIRPDASAPTEATLKQYEGMLVANASTTDLAALFAADPKSGTQMSDHIFIIDIFGNLMMRFPKDADPSKMKKDLARLLKASGVR
jgi:hypothetical protein